MTTATDEFFKRKVQSEMVTIGKDRTLMIYRHIFTANVDASKQDCLKARGTRSAIFVCKATIFVCKAKEEELNPTINLPAVLRCSDGTLNRGVVCVPHQTDMDYEDPDSTEEENF